MHHRMNRFAKQFRFSPTKDILGRLVHVRDPALGIGGVHPIAQGIEHGAGHFGILVPDAIVRRAQLDRVQFNRVFQQYTLIFAIHILRTDRLEQGVQFGRQGRVFAEMTLDLAPQRSLCM